ncbi:hypothetical protein U1Q18_008568 [Sarracenia purpurea var. burkii]
MDCFSYYGRPKPSAHHPTSSSSSSRATSGKEKKKKGNNDKRSCSKLAAKLSTDPQSVAARERRHRISDRFKILQSLVPGGTKMDTVSMLEEAIHYVKFLKTQIWLHQTMINFMDDSDQSSLSLLPPASQPMSVYSPENLAARELTSPSPQLWYPDSRFHVAETMPFTGSMNY